MISSAHILNKKTTLIPNVLLRILKTVYLQDKAQPYHEDVGISLKSRRM